MLGDDAGEVWRRWVFFSFKGEASTYSSTMAVPRHGQSSPSTSIKRARGMARGVGRCRRVWRSSTTSRLSAAMS